MSKFCPLKIAEGALYESESADCVPMASVVLVTGVVNVALVALATWYVSVVFTVCVVPAVPPLPVATSQMVIGGLIVPELTVPTSCAGVVPLANARLLLGNMMFSSAFWITLFESFATVMTTGNGWPTIIELGSEKEITMFGAGAGRSK